jgi:hypothetical protein
VTLSDRFARYAKCHFAGDGSRRSFPYTPERRISPGDPDRFANRTILRSPVTQAMRKVAPELGQGDDKMRLSQIDEFDFLSQP